MKKLLALLLALVMVFSMMTVLTACSDDGGDSSYEDEDDDDDDDDDKKDDEEDPEPSESEPASIVGTWKATIQLADVVNESMAAQDETTAQYMSVDSFAMVMVLEFSENGTVVSYVDEDALDAELEALREDWYEGFTSYIQDMITSSDMGLTVEDFETQMGATVEELVDVIVDTMISTMKESMEAEESEYQLDGDQLTMESMEGVITVEIDGDEMKFVKYEGEDSEQFDMILAGAVFERQ